MADTMHAPGCQPDPDRDPYVGCECGATIRPHMPTEAEVRSVWSFWRDYGGLTNAPHSATTEEAVAEFDRFLANVRAEAERKGAVEALREAAALCEDGPRVWVQKAGGRTKPIRLRDWLDDVADRIEAEG